MQEFWTTTLRQVAHNNIAIQHATCALGSFWGAKQDVVPQQSTEKNAFAFQQYNKAIRLLTEMSIKNPGPDVTSLVCFILFITAELLLGDGRRASHLLKIELDMLRQWSSLSNGTLATLTEKTVISKHIGPMLIRFWLQVDPLQETLTKDISMALDPNYSEADRSIDGEDITSFKSLHEAKEGLQSIIESTFSGLHMYTSRGDAEKIHRIHASGESLLSAWKARFSTWCRQYEVSRAEYSTVFLLRVQSQAAELILGTLGTIDNFPTADEFSQQVDLCESFLEFHTQLDLKGDREAGFFMDHAIIPALFFTATRCADSQVSDRALAVLRSKDWQEGFWRSRDVAAMASNVRREQRLRTPSGLVARSPSLHSPEAYGGDAIFSWQGGVEPMPACAWEFLGGHKLVVTGSSSPGFNGWY